MMDNMRTKNSINNVGTGFIVNVFSKLLAFIVRTIFIRELGREILGLNSLFTSIFEVLSILELGFGVVCSYHLYKPVAKKDISKINSYLIFIRKFYLIITIVILVFGIGIIPIFPLIIGDVSKISENITLIYLLFLINSIIPYLYFYKKNLIVVYQKQSIINKIEGLCNLLKGIIEIIIILLFKLYTLYLIVEIAISLLEWFIVLYKVKKIYPYKIDNNKLSKKDKKSVYQNVKYLITYKFGSIVMNSSNNIFISLLMDLGMVGIMANYYLIINALSSVLTSSLDGVVASIGNLGVLESRDKKIDIYYKMIFIYYLIYSFCAISFIVLANPFIKLWLGNKYLLDFNIPLVIGLIFFFDGIRQPNYIYRVSLGLFKKAQIAPFIGSIINIILTIILYKYIGIIGIFIATLISKTLSYGISDIYLIFKYVFSKSVKDVYINYFKYLLLFTIELVISYYLCYLIPFRGITNFIIQGLVVIIVPNIINIFVFRNSDYFKWVYKVIKIGKYNII